LDARKASIAAAEAEAAEEAARDVSASKASSVNGTPDVDFHLPAR